MLPDTQVLKRVFDELKRQRLSLQRPCASQAKSHNFREKELDYVRPELSHLNESWVGDSIRREVLISPILKYIIMDYLIGCRFLDSYASRITS